MRNLSVYVLLSALCLRMSAEEPAPNASRELTLARQIEKAVLDSDTAHLDELLGVPELLDRILKKTAMAPEVKDAFLAGFKAASVGGNVLQSCKGGKFRLLRFRESGGRRNALFRILASTGGVDYMECRFGDSPTGAFVCEDIYFFQTGEWISASLERTIMKSAVALGKVPAAQSEEEKAWIEGMKGVVLMKKSIEEGDFSGALEGYEALPEAVRNEKGVMLMRLGAAFKVGKKPYKEALDAYAKRFPEDPSLDLFLIDINAMQRKFDEVAEVTKRLAVAVGGDPALDALRALALEQGGNLEAGAKLAREAAAAEKGLTAAHLVLLVDALKRQDHPETAVQMTAMEKDCSFPLGRIEENPKYAEFVKSEEYKKWKASRGK